MSDRDTDAFVLSAWAMVNASLCPAATSGKDFPSFITKDLLCGSHIQNADIHLSAEQKDHLDTPYVTSSYFGTSGTQSIKLGFKPSLVIVLINGMPIYSTDVSTGNSAAYFGVGFERGASIGLEVTDTGFKVRTSSSSDVEGCFPHLNDLGTTYRYIAFK